MIWILSEFPDDKYVHIRQGVLAGSLGTPHFHPCLGRFRRLEILWVVPHLYCFVISLGSVCQFTVQRKDTPVSGGPIFFLVENEAFVA
jgi:hypothetical protein